VALPNQSCTLAIPSRKTTKVVKRDVNNNPPRIAPWIHQEKQQGTDMQQHWSHVGASYFIKQHQQAKIG